MSNFNEEVCEYISSPFTENFISCPSGDVVPTSICPSGCAIFWGDLYTCFPGE